MFYKRTKKSQILLEDLIREYRGEATSPGQDPEKMSDDHRKLRKILQEFRLNQDPTDLYEYAKDAKDSPFVQ